MLTPYLQTQVSIPMYTTYRSPLHFSHLDSFIPQRWLRPQTAKPELPVHNPKAFNPFSIGPRNCIGKKLGMFELRLILVKLLWNFDLTRKGPDRNWEEQKTYMIWEKRGLVVKLAESRY